MTGICRDFQQAADSLPHQTTKTYKGPFSATRGLAPGGLGTRQDIVDLAMRLPNSDLNFAVDFLPVFSKEKGLKKSTKKSPAKLTGNLLRKIPLGFLQKPSLEFFRPFLRGV